MRTAHAFCVRMTFPVHESAGRNRHVDTRIMLRWIDVRTAHGLALRTIDRHGGSANDNVIPSVPVVVIYRHIRPYTKRKVNLKTRVIEHHPIEMSWRRLNISIGDGKCRIAAKQRRTCRQTVRRHIEPGTPIHHFHQIHQRNRYAPMSSYQILPSPFPPSWTAKPSAPCGTVTTAYPAHHPSAPGLSNFTRTLPSGNRQLFFSV